MTDQTYRKWVQHFAELDTKGVPYTAKDMTRKAQELAEEKE